MLRTLLRNVYPIEKLSLEHGRKADIYLSLALDTNRLNGTILPVRRWTSFMFDSGGMSSTTFILSGFTSIPQLLTIKPENFLAETPKAHLAGFNFMLYSLKIWNASDR